jgi:hypothetical protein
MKECNHQFLTPSGNRTTCIRCGRDGYIYLDIDPTHRIELLKSIIETLEATVKIQKAHLKLFDKDNL